MRDSRRFLAGVFISRLGDSFSFLAFVLLLVDRSASCALVSAFMVARYLPGAALAAGARRIFDRVTPKPGLIVVYGASGVLTAAACGATGSTSGLLLLSALLGVSYGMYVPMQKAFIALVFPPAEILGANVQVQLADVLAKNVGFLLAGVVFRRGGASLSFAIDAASFFAIAGLIAGVRPRFAPSATADARPSSVGDRRALVFHSAIFAFAWLGTGALFALEAGYARRFLHASESMIGALFACATLGAVFAARGRRLLARLAPTGRERLLVLACLSEMVFVAGYARTGSLPPAVACIVGYGLLLTLRHVLISAWIHQGLPPHEHARAFAIQQGLANVGMMLGMGMSGPLAEVFGMRAVITGAAALSGGAIVGIWVARLPKGAPRWAQPSSSMSNP